LALIASVKRYSTPTPRWRDRLSARRRHDGSGTPSTNASTASVSKGRSGKIQAEPRLDPLIAWELEALQARFDGPVGDIEGSTWRYSGESAEKDHCGASPRFGRGA